MTDEQTVRRRTARRGARRAWWALLALACPLAVDAGGPAPAALAVSAVLPAPPAGVADLRFAEFFQTPVGPRGLVPSARLLALDGQPVRIVGYMAAGATPIPGRLVLSPLPLDLGGDDDHLADDLPAQVVFVHLGGAAAGHRLPPVHGLLQLQGRLSIGPRDEPDGHVSSVRLLLDATDALALLAAARPVSDAASGAPVPPATH